MDTQTSNLNIITRAKGRTLPKEGIYIANISVLDTKSIPRNINLQRKSHSKTKIIINTTFLDKIINNKLARHSLIINQNSYTDILYYLNDQLEIYMKNILER